jgi:hypothetical protein
MLMEWLEPSIKGRIERAVDGCCNDQRIKDLYGEFVRIVETNCPQLLYELESIFNASFRVGADIAYRSGFHDGLELGFDINKNFAPNLLPIEHKYLKVTK